MTAAPRPSSASVSAPNAGPNTITRLGMEGSCPVTLFEEDKWVTGDKRWGVRHRGRVYLFSNATAQQRFLSDPDLFSPILAGFDPVAFSDEGTYIEGERSHGIRFQDRIVLFSTEENLQRFAQAPTKYLDSVYQAMRQSSLHR